MTDTDDNNADKTAQTATADDTPEPTKKSGNGVGGIALLLSLVAIGGTGALGWFGWQTQQQIAEQMQTVSSTATTAQQQTQQHQSGQQKLSSQIQQTQKSFSSTKQQLSKAAQDADAKAAKALAQSEANNQALRAELAKLREQLTALGGEPTSTWYRANAISLLEIASQRLNLAGDVGGAVNALQAADQTLFAADQPALASVRQRIGEEIAQLRNVAAVDTAKLSDQLQQLTQTVEKISREKPTALRKHQAPKASSGASNTQRPSSWDEVVDDAWSGLKTLVVVRRNEERAEPLPPPEQGPSLGERFALSIEAAQVALARTEQNRFQQALGRAEQHLNALARTHNVPEKVQTTLATLSGTKITQDLPEIGGALALLKDAPASPAAEPAP